MILFIEKTIIGELVNWGIPFGYKNVVFFYFSFFKTFNPQKDFMSSQISYLSMNMLTKHGSLH